MLKLQQREIKMDEHNRVSSSRRKFLKLGSTVLAGSMATLPRVASAQTDADYWHMVRNQFAFSDKAVPMNAANLCPSFRAVGENVALLTADIDIDCSFNNRAKFTELLEQSRMLVAAQLGVSAEEIALVRNTSEGNNIINNGLSLSAGDEVVIWDQNHPTNNVAWDVRAERFNLQITRLSTPDQPASEQELADIFINSFTNRTRVLSFTHISNVSGIRLPIRTIVEAARTRGIYVHVDGAQSWGALDLDLRELDVDSFTASAHKWYMGPKEVGLLYVKQDNIERIWPGVIAPGWGEDSDTDLAGARKFESLGQRDDAALAALGLAAQLHNDIGQQRTEVRIAMLAQRLKQGIAELGLELVTPMSDQLSHGVCITRAPQGQAETIINRLYEEFGIAAAPTGGIRLCPTIYNTELHIDRAVDGLRAIMT
ncbi:MAG: aminotransferase class V-fold PLP-dependent enzyme [Gammaproteobacteria bacterium]|nr:aminotransferase class V-fold PLP-dependent enzyme [Gammaproteobacteria bacterium]